MAKEREGMAAVGPPSIDRRAFMHLDDACNSSRVRQLMCLVCAQTKTDMGIVRRAVNKRTGVAFDNPLSDIAYREGRGLWRCFRETLGQF